MSFLSVSLFHAALCRSLMFLMLIARTMLIDCLLWMQEVRELEALAKKAEELGRDPILLAKEKNSGTGVAAAFK